MYGTGEKLISNIEVTKNSVLEVVVTFSASPVNAGSSIQFKIFNVKNPGITRETESF